MATLSKGSKVYIDGFAGLISGVVVAMVSQHSSEYTGIQYPTSASVYHANAFVAGSTARGFCRITLRHKGGSMYTLLSRLLCTVVGFVAVAVALGYILTLAGL